jgi:hypothetical protein
MYDMAIRSKTAMQVETPVNPSLQTVTVYVQAKWRFIPPVGG